LKEVQKQTHEASDCNLLESLLPRKLFFSLSGFLKTSKMEFLAYQLATMFVSVALEVLTFQKDSFFIDSPIHRPFHRITKRHFWASNKKDAAMINVNMTTRLRAEERKSFDSLG
jgi:hypothetical protein